MLATSPQRRRRAHRPARPTPRLANDADHQAMLAARLTPRDRWLIRVLYEHRVLTSTQITDAAFTIRRLANRRLRELYQWRVLDRFHPYTPHGDVPLHYVIDTAGHAVLTNEDDAQPGQVGYRHAETIGIAHSLQLAHTLGVNGVFTSLIRHARTTANAELLAWWSEARCTRHFGDLVRPDAYGRWRDDGRAVEFFLEYDCGTETHARLARKLFDYDQLAAASGIATPVLFVFDTPNREAAARDALAGALRGLEHRAHVPVATTSDTDAASAGWLPVAVPAHETSRRTLAGLASAWPSLRPPNGAADPHDAPTESPDRLRPPTPMPPAASPVRADPDPTTPGAP